MVQRKTPPKATSSPKTQAVSSVAKAMLMASLTAWKVFIFFVSPTYSQTPRSKRIKKKCQLHTNCTTAALLIRKPIQTKKKAINKKTKEE